MDPNQNLPIEISPNQKRKGFRCQADIQETYWRDHQDGNKVMGLIRRTFIHLDKEVFVPLYTSLVRSHLEYAQSVWSPHSKGGIRRLEQVQRNATRLVNGTQGMNYHQRLKYLNLPTLLHRRTRGDMIALYKMLHSIYDSECIPRLHRIEGVTRGHPIKLFKMRTLRLDLRRNFSL